MNFASWSSTDICFFSGSLFGNELSGIEKSDGCFGCIVSERYQHHNIQENFLLVLHVVLEW
jgi:hypothetical protein